MSALLHQSQSGWTAATSFQELFDSELINIPVRRFVPSLEVVLDDDSHMSDEAAARLSISSVEHGATMRASE